MFSIKKNRYLLLSFLFFGLVLLPLSNVFAADCITSSSPNPCCPGPPPACGFACPECVEVPLNDGIVLLMIAGVAFGVKKTLFSK